MKLLASPARVFTLGLGCILAATLATYSPPPAQSPHYAVATVFSTYTGSGTLIGTFGDKALILSCRHVCVRVGAPAEVVWGDGQRKTGKVIDVIQGPGSSFGNDLALIVVDKPEGIQPVPVVKFDPENGPWTAAGWRDGKLYVSKPTEATANPDGSIDVNSAFIGGMSGGALFDCNGCIVGVVVASSATGAPYGIASDGDNLHKLLEKWSR